ncbi:MAG TPA: hypothetical protein VGQ42_00785 [Candidatus Dormibacteraeota bacterium]|jgi:hypothetical protein|nr:hypothetical protein [Candidatus Dormibacteraeota bacterium]
MNRRTSERQLALPGVAPLCPHCGGRRTALSSAGAEGDVVSGQPWECQACGRSFWSLPSLGTAAPRSAG